MSRIAMLGMGAMGSRMALVLLRHGWRVTVWNRTRARTEPLVAAGAETTASPREAVAGCGFAISMARDDEASRRVWLDPEDGALAAMPPGAIAIESATVTPGWARELAEACRARGVAFLDAPVAGSRPQADAGQLIFLVGGDADTLAKAHPLLSAMGAAVHHAGAAGAGATVKLAINALFGVQVAVVAELIGFLERSGVAVDAGVEILAATPVCSPAAKLAAKAMTAGNFAPMFPIDLVEKDFGYAQAAAEAQNAPVPVVRAARQTFSRAKRAGHGGDNITGVAQLYREGRGA